MIFTIPTHTATSIPGFTIRRAGKEDVNLVLNFIKQLAQYEQLLHVVVADEDTLASYLFAEQPFAYVIIGEYKGEPVGFALFFTNFSTFLGKPGVYLEDLFVLPEFRGRGLGRTLLAFLAKLAVDNSFGRVDWWVLKWNEPAIKVYKGIGAKPMDEWTVFRLTGSELQTMSKQL